MRLVEKKKKKEEDLEKDEKAAAVAVSHHRKVGVHSVLESVKKDRKSKWMASFESEVTALSPSHSGKINWDSASHHYNTGKSPKEAAQAHVNSEKPVDRGPWGKGMKLSEASKDKLLKYVGKAVHSYGNAVNNMHFSSDVMKNSKTQTKRFVGIDQAARKLAGKGKARVAATNEETINEISRNVLNSYIGKALPDASNLTKQSRDAHEKKPWSHAKLARKADKRYSGVNTAAYKTQLGPEGGSVNKHKAWVKEDTVTEASKEKLRGYISNAVLDYGRKKIEKKDLGMAEFDDIKRLSRKSLRRFDGINDAANKISGSAKVKVHATEETILEMTDTKIRRYIGKALSSKKNRTKGVNLGADKIEKKAKVPASLNEARNKPIPDHPYHSKSDAELKYIQKDAHEAAKNMRGMDDKAEAKYLDQVNDASTVLYYRKRHGKGRDEPKKLDEAMKLVKAHEHEGHIAKVYHDKEWGEYRVKAFPKDGSHREQEDYHTDNVEDAHATAQHMLQQMAGKKKSLNEARFKIVKARIRKGKIERRKKVATQVGWTLRGGKLKRMSAAERRRRKLGQRRGKIKRRAKLSRTLVKRKRSLIKRERLHLK